MALLDGLTSGRVTVDRGCDADRFIDGAHSLGAQTVIPPRSGRTRQCEYDRNWYRSRNLARRFLNRIK